MVFGTAEDEVEKGPKKLVLHEIERVLYPDSARFLEYEMSTGYGTIQPTE